MRLRVGAPRRAMVIAPHADDEAIGAGKLVITLRQRGTQVTVVVVSDGAASHPASRRWPRARLVAERRRETRRAMLRLGVDAGAIVFLGLPDGNLPGAEDRCCRAIRREVARRRPDLLVGPCEDDAHPDHRIVAAAIAAIAGRTRQLVYRVWPPRRAGERRVLRLSAGAATVGKRSLIRCYRTQCGAITDDPGGFAIARHELDLFSQPVERFREVR